MDKIVCKSKLKGALIIEQSSKKNKWTECLEDAREARETQANLRKELTEIRRGID